MRFLWVLWLGTGCAYISDKHEDWRLDPDEDGVSIVDDCDDGDGNVGAPSPWYADKDEDGFGDTDDVTYRCTQPDGHVEIDGDCDDTEATVYPLAQELCDQIDNNCDGTVDEGLALTTLYADVDGDGFGDPNESEEACGEQDGMVGNGDDCDDSDPTWHDQGPVEIPYNGIDDNCDALDGDGDRDLDGFWASDYHERVVAVGATPMDVHPDVSGDCDDDNASVRPGAFEVWYDGIDSDCDGRNDCDHDDDGYESNEGVCTPDEADCNDLVDTVNPGMEELCATEVDDDCDGSVEAEDSPDCENFYLDFDGDGFGSDDSRCACSASFPYSAATSGDCDDTEFSVNPEAFDVAYDGVDSDCGGEDDYDFDGDGYVPSVFAGEATVGVVDSGALPGGDCDDGDASIHPDASEDCLTLVDDDCDGETNSRDALNCDDFFRDADLDGYGDEEDSECWCDAVASHPTDLGGDCVDTDALYGPEAEDTWYDGEDTDCAENDDYDADFDGYADAAHGASATFWFIDGDLVSVEAADDTRLSEEGDCDDTDPAVHPDASEICDEIDNDCDSEVDESPIDAPTLYADADGDGFGAEGDTVVGCSADGYVLDGSDCDDSDAFTYPEAPEICDAIDQDCDGDVSEDFSDLDGDGDPDCIDPVGADDLTGVSLQGISGGSTGSSILIGGDGHLYVGAPAAVDGDARVYVLDAVPEADDSLESMASVWLRGVDGFGQSLVEIEGDGFPLLAVGSPQDNAAILLDDPSLGGFADAGSGDALFASLTEELGGGEECGRALASGRLGADASETVMVGCPLRSDGGFAVDASGWVGDSTLAEIGQAVGPGIAFSAEFGHSLDVGDVNGDGIDDAVIGARRDDRGCEGSSCGGAYVFFGPIVGPEPHLASDGFLAGSGDVDSLGSFVATAEDLDGDGVVDLMIATDMGWTDELSPMEGALLLFSGSAFVGTLTEDDAFQRLQGTETGALFASFAADVPDVDGDDSREILISAHKDDTVGDGAGVVYAAPGPFTGGVRIVPGVDLAVYGHAASAQFGRTIVVGDVGADGALDVVIGSPGASRVWVYSPEALFGVSGP